MLMANERCLSCLLAVSGLLLMGCQPSVDQEVESKLAAIHATTSPPPDMKHLDVASDVVHYQPNNDPFASPFGRNHQSHHDRDEQDTARQSKSLEETAKPVAPTAQNHIEKLTTTPQIFGKRMTVNPSRSREILEQYPLASLRYQGRVEKDGRLMAMVLSPDGVAHHVRVGQYIGENHGVITHISHEQIGIVEASLQIDGHYYERKTHLAFSTGQ